jgi:hypothetical protein
MHVEITCVCGWGWSTSSLVYTYISSLKSKNPATTSLAGHVGIAQRLFVMILSIEVIIAPFVSFAGSLTMPPFSQIFWDEDG